MQDNSISFVIKKANFPKTIPARVPILAYIYNSYKGDSSTINKDGKNSIKSGSIASLCEEVCAIWHIQKITLLVKQHSIYRKKAS